MQGVSPSAGQSGQDDEEHAIVVVEPRALNAATQHDELLSEQGVLGNCSCIALPPASLQSSVRSSDRVRVRSPAAPATNAAAEHAGRSQRLNARPRATIRAKTWFVITVARYVAEDDRPSWEPLLAGRVKLRRPAA